MSEQSKFDEGYDRGFNAGVESVKSTDYSEDLRKRYAYLKLGGSWQVDCDRDDQPAGSYLAGFEDAMKTLGVTP